MKHQNELYHASVFLTLDQVKQWKGGMFAHRPDGRMVVISIARGWEKQIVNLSKNEQGKFIIHTIENGKMKDLSTYHTFFMHKASYLRKTGEVSTII